MKLRLSLTRNQRIKLRLLEIEERLEEMTKADYPKNSLSEDLKELKIMLNYLKKDLANFKDEN